MTKRIVRSARGEIVDFDLLTIKEQIAAAPPPITIRARENFIDRQLKRRTKNILDQAAALAVTEVSIEPISVTQEQVSPMIEEEIQVEDDNITITTKQKAKKKVDTDGNTTEL